MFNSDGKKTAVERDKWKTVIEWRRKKKCQNQWNLWTLENIFLSRQQAPDGIFSEPLIFTASLAMEFVWKSNYFVKLFPKSFATNFQNDCNHEIAPTFATFSESNLTLNEPPRDHKWNEKSQSNNIHKFYCWRNNLTDESREEIVCCSQLTSDNMFYAPWSYIIK